MESVILTIGHSTRALADFIAILRAHGVTRLVDVRTVPRSRRNPQFNRDTLPTPLAEAGIGYAHLAELGGLRRPRPDSPNTAWRNESFRGYADYMLTPAFTAALTQLIELATADRVAVMCAEVLPWRCHRALIADALLARGLPVEHILDATHRDPHRLTPFAVLDGPTVTYPPAPEDQGEKA